MRARFFYFSIVLVFVALFSACDDKTLPSLKINKGEIFPSMQLSDLQASPVSVGQANKVRIINIWATWCGPCRHELPSLQRLSNKLDQSRFQVVGVSIDDDEHRVREYLNEKKIHYANFIDMDMSIANDILGVRIFPSTYLVRADGSIADIIEGWREWDSPEMLARINAL